MLGYRCLFPSDTPSDDAILKLTKKEGCILLTRDKYLCQKAKKEGLRCIFMPPSLEEGLATLALLKLIELKLPSEPRYCSICGAPLKFLGTFPTRGKVWVCTRCGQPYWFGTHWRNIEKKLRKAAELKRLRKKDDGGSVADLP